MDFLTLSTIADTNFYLFSNIALISTYVWIGLSLVSTYTNSVTRATGYAALLLFAFGGRLGHSLAEFLWPSMIVSLVIVFTFAFVSKFRKI